jgi:serine/threonine protein kinase
MPEVKDLIQKLLAKNPDERIGAQDLHEIEHHLFFEGVCFDTLRDQIVPYTAPTIVRSPITSKNSYYGFGQSKSIRDDITEEDCKTSEISVESSNWIEFNQP